MGRPEKDNSWEPLSFLQAMPPYVLKLVRDYDERLRALQGGMEVRPITQPEVKAHLAAFGIDEQLALSKIRGFSGGQKSRLVLAAAMWNKPHLIALDEPTNYCACAALCARCDADPPSPQWTERAWLRWPPRSAASRAPACWSATLQPS